jgi:hypothetical protein
MADERVRIEIGFEGGTIMGAQVSAEGAERLTRKLEAGADGTVELEVEDGSCVVVANRVLYVKRFARESRVGFGASA